MPSLPHHKSGDIAKGAEGSSRVGSNHDINAS